MDALYSEEERLLRSSMREFAERELAPNAARWDQNEEFPWVSVEALKGMGLMGLTMDPAYGGAGAPYTDLAIVGEEIARACVTTCTTYLTHLSLSSTTIAMGGNDEQKKRYLPRMTDGSLLGAFALTEPSSGSDAADMQTTATRDGDDYVLNGTKIFITNGAEADVYVVFTSTDRSLGAKGTSAFIVEKDSPGLSTNPMHGKMGIRGSGTAEVVFEDVRVPAANLLRAEGEGFRIAMQVIDASRIALATQSVGLAQAALDASMRYVQQRATFGALLKERQAIQFMLADMDTQLTAARLITRHAAQLKDAGQPYSKASAQAKLFASEAAHSCADKAVQIHGGYGFFRESVVERLYRDQRIMEIYEGTSEVQRIVISRALLKEYAAS